MALAVEEPSRVDEQAGSVDVAQHDAVFFDFQAFLGVNGSLHFAGNAHHSALDISFDFSLVVDHHSSVGNNITLDVGVQPDKPTRNLHISFQLHTGLKPADPIVRQVGEVRDDVLRVCSYRMPFRPPAASRQLRGSAWPATSSSVYPGNGPCLVHH